MPRVIVRLSTNNKLCCATSLKRYFEVMNIICLFCRNLLKSSRSDPMHISLFLFFLLSSGSYHVRNTT